MAVSRVQQVLWELEIDYLGHPYYVTGNAIYHAIGQRLDADTTRRLNASHGMFVPGQFGTFPEEHSKSGTKPYLGSSLPEVNAYDDLFLFREPSSPWLLDGQPRDALNTHPVRTQHGQPAFAPETIIGRPDDHRYDTQTTTWYIHAYLHADDPDVLPLDQATLDGLQFGGQRNYGYGRTQVKDTQLIELDALDYSRLRDREAYTLTFITPFVLRSEYPSTNDVDVPWWWAVDEEATLRYREERIVEGADVFRCETVDHGQVVGYSGDRPLETAKSAITRVGSHSKYGFGEIRVRPIADHHQHGGRALASVGCGEVS